MTPDDTDWVPVDACTLPTAQRPLRLAEFDDLFAEALRDLERLQPTRLRLALDASAEGRTRDLAARESACCSFFTFTVEPAPDGRLRLQVDVPAERVDVLDGLAERAAAAAGIDRSTP